MTAKQPYLTVVVPAYNEESNLRMGVLDSVVLYLEKQRFTWELLIVDDGSTDATRTLLAELVKRNKNVSVRHNEHQGKASTVISGMLEAKGEIVLFTDLDQATPINQMEKLLPWFSKGYEVVIGSRSGQRRGAPMTRRIMALGFMWLRGLFLGLRGIKDTQCGFKAFTREAARNISGRLRLYGTRHIVHGSNVTAGFDIEMLFIARKLGYKIREVPVEWHYVETRRVNPITDSIQGLMDIFHIRANAWKGYYG